MMQYKQQKRQSGISLVEVLISLVVLSFGLLAIATFQTKLISGSGDNKTRGEAMALAQQKLDDLRSYSSETELVAKLTGVDHDTVADLTTIDDFPREVFTSSTVVDCDFTDTGPAYQTFPGTAETIDGTNAQYSRQWKICRPDPLTDTTTVSSLGTDELLFVLVEVSWTDMDADTQTVSLQTTVSWRNVASTADVGDVPAEPLVPSATGRAYLGDGSVTQAQLEGGTDNLDGTTTVLKANDGADVALVDSETKEIVLTLVDACRAQDGSCFGFVKVSGRVYFDSSSSITPSTVYVLASDAAYCARVFADDFGNPKSVTDINSDGSDYTYFDYTCYLGGGWYGNIGLVFTNGGLGNNDNVCVGDPDVLIDTTKTNDGDYKWSKPELATRRVYRGMTYAREDSGDGTYSLWRTDNTGGTAAIDYTYLYATSEPIWYSKGVGDSVLFPDIDPDTGVPVWADRDGGHDYVVFKNTGTTDYTDCETFMSRPDSRTWTDIDGDSTIDYAESFTDADGDGEYDPAEDYVDANGNGSYDAGEDFTDANGNGTYDVAESFTDANGNGVYDYEELGELGSLFARVPADFICLNEEDPANDPRLYPYLDEFNGESSTFDSNDAVYGAPDECPFDPSRPPSNKHLVMGYIYNTTMGSGDYSHLEGTSLNTSDGADDCQLVDNHTDLNVVTNPTGAVQAYACRVYEWGDGWTGTVNLKHTAAVACTTVSREYDSSVTGAESSVTADRATTNEDFYCENLTDFVVAGTITAPSQDLTGISVTATRTDGMVIDCAPTQGATVAEFGYSCTVLEEDLGAGWFGTVELTLPEGSTIECPTTSKTYSPLSASVYNLDLECLGPIETHTFSGTITGDSGVDLTGVSVSAVSTSVNSTVSSCSLGAYDAVSNTVPYSCTVTERGAGWSGEVTVTPVGDVSCSSVTVTNVTDDSVSNADSTCKADLSGQIFVTGNIFRNTSDAHSISISYTNGTTSGVGTCSDDGISYTCETPTLGHGTTWDVTVTYTAIGSQTAVCPSTTTTVVYAPSYSVTWNGLTPNGTLSPTTQTSDIGFTVKEIGTYSCASTL